MSAIIKYEVLTVEHILSEQKKERTKKLQSEYLSKVIILKD